MFHLLDGFIALAFDPTFVDSGPERERYAVSCLGLGAPKALENMSNKERLLGPPGSERLGILFVLGVQHRARCPWPGPSSGTAVGPRDGAAVLCALGEGELSQKRGTVSGG